MGLDPISSAFDLGTKLIDHFFPDPTKKAEAALELMKLQQSGELAQMTAQMDINKAEAANPNMFVAGGRPFIIWVCGVAFAWNYVLGPLTAQFSQFSKHPIMYMPLDMTTMMPVLMGLLGLGAYRTYEKVNNAEGNRS